MRKNGLKNIVELLSSYMLNRKQCVKIRTKLSDELSFENYSVIQGSNLGPILFIFFINDIFELQIPGEMFLFADNITLVFKDKNIHKLNDKVNESMIIISEYLERNQMVLNVKKSAFLLFGTNNLEFSVKYRNEIIEQKTSIKILGIIFDNKLSFKNHINETSIKLSKICGIFGRIRHFMPIFALKILYTSLVVPHLIYGCPVWCFSADTHLNRLIKLQKRLSRTICFENQTTESETLFRRLNWISFQNLRIFEIMKYIFKNINGLGCSTRFFEYENQGRTRSSSNRSLKLFSAKYSYTQKTIFFDGIKIWNSFDVNLRELKTFGRFKRMLLNILK